MHTLCTFRLSYFTTVLPGGERDCSAERIHPIIADSTGQDRRASLDYLKPPTCNATATGLDPRHSILANFE
ncbi:MAG: hypothetical protein ACRERU_22215 [Methylococcales bacterium]